MIHTCSATDKKVPQLRKNEYTAHRTWLKYNFLMNLTFFPLFPSFHLTNWRLCSVHDTWARKKTKPNKRDLINPFTRISHSFQFTHVQTFSFPRIFVLIKKLPIDGVSFVNSLASVFNQEKKGLLVLGCQLVYQSNF